MRVPDALRHGSDEELGCYSQMYSTRAEVLRPADVEELALIFAEARDRGRRLTLRAGGNSFDAQSLGSDMVVSLERLDAIGEVIDVDADECITVGAGATWGDILEKVEPLGLVPAIMVTTEKATAGGTLSGNCLSRFSPTLGKEGGWVKSFRLLTVGGERILCTPPDDDERPETWTLPQRVFMAAIGGLGYIGAVYEITYKLVRAYDPDVHGVAPLAMKTTLTKHKTYEHLAEALVGEARRMCHTDIPEGMTLADAPGEPGDLLGAHPALERQAVGGRVHLDVHDGLRARPAGDPPAQEPLSLRRRDAPAHARGLAADASSPTTCSTARARRTSTTCAASRSSWTATRAARRGASATA